MVESYSARASDLPRIEKIPTDRDVHPESPIVVEEDLFLHQYEEFHEEHVGKTLEEVISHGLEENNQGRIWIVPIRQNSIESVESSDSLLFAIHLMLERDRTDKAFESNMTRELVKKNKLLEVKHSTEKAMVEEEYEDDILESYLDGYDSFKAKAKEKYGNLNFDSFKASFDKEDQEGV
ncbi:unnamed protein product [Ilex paraguariensis]|uniref:Uncharacterized protein n=1 Tax=Ilex paraguariensis TaxID=185542 RepID=A0ABC8TVN6_9AQUA